MLLVEHVANQLQLNVGNLEFRRTDHVEVVDLLREPELFFLFAYLWIVVACS